MPVPVLDRDFATLLDEFGPQAERTVSPEEARRHCRSLAAGHYENFPVLSLALPRALRQDFANVYAFCRWADDLGDEVDGTNQSLELLDWWQRELDDCFAGRVRHPVFVAIRETIDRHQIPKRPFDDLMSAFRQDQTFVRYATFDELRAYCRRSADPVGRIVLHLCGCFSEENAIHSDSVCTGLQLINFWQDVARDFDIGRVYLPQEDRERFGYAEDALNRRRTDAAFIDLMRFEVERARSFLREGLPLADRMPGRLKAVIALFALGGLRICDRVEAIGYRVWDERPSLTKTDGIRLFAAAARRALSASVRRER